MSGKASARNAASMRLSEHLILIVVVWLRSRLILLESSLN
jgi:hypothetical protein